MMPEELEIKMWMIKFNLKVSQICKLTHLKKTFEKMRWTDFYNKIKQYRGMKLDKFKLLLHADFEANIGKVKISVTFRT